MKLPQKYKYLIYAGIVICFLIIIDLVVYNRHKKIEQFDAEVKEYHNTEITSSPNDKTEMLKLAKLADKQNADSEFDRNIDETQLAKV